MLYRTTILWTTLLLSGMTLSACGGSSDNDSGGSTDATSTMEDDTGGVQTDLQMVR